MKPYILITGSSKGIGKAMAELLAEQKNNLLLLARSEQILADLARELTQKHSIDVQYLAIDLAKDNAAEEVLQWVESNHFPIQALINNAGYGLSGSFEKYPLIQHKDMMRLNMLAPVQLTYLLLPILKQQQRSYVLNIASAAAYQAVPGLTLYAATKSFLLSFSRGLQFELQNSNVSVTVVCPGATDTDFPNRAQVGPKAQKAAAHLNMSANEVATLAIHAMYAGKTEKITGFVNQLGVIFAWLLPKKWVEKAAAGMYKE
ncbi:SDR family oxidoreductase [Hydrotalea sp.]|uniref:SDR family NAD(P)-dependent oxidoreductase n=1 Tax=Hydrotalea sp. TaxID=2881279 RepID=UPI002620BB98|nr:SDR family oxidoreductase [Hydrotalea sp.]